MRIGRSKAIHSLILAAALALPVLAAAEGELAVKPAVGVVARAAITNGIAEREPIDALNRVTNDHETIYFFTELRDFTDQQVIHRWSYRGKTMAEVPFQVHGSRWRVWSTKKMNADWLGAWKVEVVSAHGEVFETSRFEYIAAPAAPVEPEAPAAPAVSEPKPAVDAP
jgi:hypothetical protein